MNPTIRHLTVFALSAVAAAAASAATTVYTSPAAFGLMLAPGAYLETFTQDEVDIGALFSYSGNGFSYDVTADGGASTVYRSGTIIGNNLPNLSLTFTFTSGNVTAVGGQFFIANISDVFQPVSVTLTLNDGTTVSYLPPGVAGAFRGFTSTVPIASLTMSAPPLTGQFYNSVDNLVVGSMIPEPGTTAMMALGLLGLLGVARRRRANG
jgi:hypothetical protein